MKIIVGIGNKGKQYDKTRHNAGFMVIDELAKLHSVSLDNKNWKSNYGTLLIPNGEKTLIIKPKTFVNLSGQTVQAIMTFYKIPKEDILIVVDDIHLNIGTLRYREKGSSGGHNGLKDIQQRIGPDYSRLRLGIGQPTHNQVNHVLGKFSTEEKPLLESMISKATNCCEKWIKGDNYQELTESLNQ